MGVSLHCDKDGARSVPSALLVQPRPLPALAAKPLSCSLGPSCTDDASGSRLHATCNHSPGGRRQVANGYFTLEKNYTLGCEHARDSAFAPCPPTSPGLVFQ